jgi:hypothetical protein
MTRGYRFMGLSYALFRRFDAKTIPQEDKSKLVVDEEAEKMN